VVNKAADFITAKTNMENHVGAIHIGFPKTIKIGNLYIEDQLGDTLFFCNEISIRAALLPLIKQKLHVEYLHIEGLKSNISKNSLDSTFNFDPLLKAFSGNKDDKKKQQKSTWDFGLSTFALKDIQLEYTDFVDSTQMNLDLGQLSISVNSMDLSKNELNLENIDLRRTSLSLLLGSISKKKPPATINTENQPIPLLLKLGELNVEDIDFNLQFTDGNLGLTALVKKATLKPDILDLNTQTITLHDFIANTIDVKLAINPSDSSADTNTIKENLIPTTGTLDFTFGNFGWNFFIDHTELENTSCQLDMAKTPRNPVGMDYSHMAFANFNVVADSIYFNKLATGATVQSLSVKEISGPEVKNLQGKFSMDNQNIHAKDVKLNTASSELTGSVSLSYPALRRIGPDLDQLGIESNLKGSLHAMEVEPFFTPPDSWPDIRKIKKIMVNEFITAGALGEMDISSLDISLLSSTHLKSNFRISGLPSTTFTLTYKIDTFNTSKIDVLTFLDDLQLPDNIQLPPKFALTSSGWTNLSAGNTSTKIATDFGNISAEAKLVGNELSSTIVITDLDLSKILADSLFGKASFESNIEANISEKSLRSFHSATDIRSVDFNDLTFYDTNVLVEGIDSQYSMEANLADSALTANLKAKFAKKDSIEFYTLNLEISNADLQKLNLVEDYFGLSGNIGFNIEMKSQNELKGEIHLDNLDLDKTDNSFHINSIELKSVIDTNFSIFNFTSDILDADLSGNTRISELKDALIDHLDLYISLPDSMVSKKNFVFDFDLRLKQPQFFTDFLIDELEEFEFEKFSASHIDSTDLLLADISIPTLKYNNLLFKNLLFTIDSQPDSAIASLDIGSLSLDTAVIRHIGLESILKKQQAKTTFKINDINDKLKYQVIANAFYQDSAYLFTLDPEKTIIDYQQWDIPTDNSMQIINGQLMMQSASISRGNQKLWIEPRDNHLAILFENFNIQNLTSILEVDSANQLIKGDLNGFVEIIDPFGQATISTDLIVPNLVYAKEPLGELNAKLKYGQASPLAMDIQLQNKENMFHAVGTVETTLLNREVHMILESDISDVASYQPLAPKSITLQQGGIKGRLSIHGDVDRPRINGNLNLNNLILSVDPTNTLLKNNGQIEVEDNMLRFNSFNIKDTLDEQLTINGSIDLTNIKNPVYNVSMQSNNFLIVNKKIVEDEFPVLGKLYLGLDIAVRGPQSKLVVNSSFKINEATNIQYIMPGKELELITDEDIVRYIDFENEDEEITTEIHKQFIGDSIVSLIEGIDFAAFLDINPKAKFTVIVDPNSGDLTQFHLNGKLQYKYNENQPGYLSGLIEFADGFYDLSFYGLVKKRFNYDQGSAVSWSGEVMEGDINFSARYTVSTNSVGLVSNEISSYERTMYNQRLPYDVILKVTDKISYPRVSFAIDLPERYRNTYPTLDSKLNLMNQPAMESERNKQVFALLVGGTFIPENPDVNEGSSSSNFATTAARNSVNAIMTQQLNKLTGQIIQGFDVEMGVNTFEDYASGNAQTRTQLDVKVSKNLFNDRVSAEMESHINLDGSVNMAGSQSTAGMTEFAVSYKLTEKGNYRIKAFRENAYDIFDGEIQNSGIAFIFVKEFDSFGKKDDITIKTAPAELEESEKNMQK